MPSIAVPVWTTYVQPDEVAEMHDQPRAFTMKAIRENQWAAIDLAIPRKASLDLLIAARYMADHCVDYIEMAIEFPEPCSAPYKNRLSEATIRAAELDRLVQDRQFDLE
jgi:hypothetical protein